MFMIFSARFVNYDKYIIFFDGWLQYNKSGGGVQEKIYGTEGGNRTRTMSPPPDFESGASTSSATSADHVSHAL